jgi:hypothetical protein
MNVYIKGGVYTNWTLALTATNNTITTSSYMIISAEAPQSYRVTDVVVYTGILDPTLGEIIN